MSRPPRQDRRLTKVLAALRTQGGPGHSPLYRWMRQHHDTLVAAFAETPPAWGPLAAELAAVGLTDADGKPPSPASARQTWYRVRHSLARTPGQTGSAAPALAPDEIAPAVHAVAPPALGTARGPADMPRPRVTLDLRPARPAAGEQSVQAAATVATPAAVSTAGTPDATTAPDPPPGTPGHETPAEQLRRLFATIDAGKVPLPKAM